jgi:hypothetical protein
LSSAGSILIQQDRGSSDRSDIGVDIRHVSGSHAALVARIFDHRTVTDIVTYKYYLLAEAPIAAVCSGAGVSAPRRGRDGPSFPLISTCN